MQVIFLSVLEKRGIQQVGGRTVTPNVRCVFATNADVDKAIEKGQLRRDLVDRISVKITIPPLRERRGDIVALAKHFIGNAGNFDDRCLLALLKYDWPGNVRELQIKIRRALARANMDGAASVKVEHLDIPRVVPSTSDADEDVRAQLWRLADQLARAEGFEQAAGLQHRSGEILRVGDAQASKMYANYGLAAASIG
jgi:transcriptional regulator with PAS, ATPase and Fis domain